MNFDDRKVQEMTPAERLGHGLTANDLQTIQGLLNRHASLNDPRLHNQVNKQKLSVLSVWCESNFNSSLSKLQRMQELGIKMDLEEMAVDDPQYLAHDYVPRLLADLLPLNVFNVVAAPAIPLPPPPG